MPAPASAGPAEIKDQTTSQVQTTKCKDQTTNLERRELSLEHGHRAVDQSERVDRTIGELREIRVQTTDYKDQQSKADVMVMLGFHKCDMSKASGHFDYRGDLGQRARSFAFHRAFIATRVHDEQF